MTHGKTSKPARSLGCTTSTNSSQPNPFLRLHHSQWVALQAQLAMCASIRGSLIVHQGSPCIFLWRPLWHNKDSTKPSTPVLLAISTASGRKIHPSLYLCSQSKPSNRKHDMYQPLRVPSRPWESISMDFLSGMPTTQRKHDAIWVLVCRFSKMACFIACNQTTTAAQTTELYSHHVWPHFGLPITIIWARDSRFLSSFWQTLWALLGCHLNFSTAFHPQMDGQTEVVNRVLVHALRMHFSRRKQWDTYLHIL
jgi:hypothetical protein